jgi:uncharacterized membrane protein
MDKEIQGLVGLAAIGAAIGVGQLLASAEPVTTRVLIGRALISGGLGLASAAVLVFIPTVGFYAQMGIGAAIASLGTSMLERLVKKYTGA